MGQNLTRSEIPQGSVLGPLLFLIYVNDLPEIVKSVLKLFDDDTLFFNTNKCKTVTVSAQGGSMGQYTIDTEGNKTVLTVTKEEKICVSNLMKV